MISVYLNNTDHIFKYIGNVEIKFNVIDQIMTVKASFVTENEDDLNIDGLVFDGFYLKDIKLITGTK